MAAEGKLVVNINDPEDVGGPTERRVSIQGKRSFSEIGNASLVAGEKPRNISRDLFCFVLGVGKYGSFKTEKVSVLFTRSGFDLINM